MSSNSSSTKSLIKTINHYKKSLEADNVDDKRLLHCFTVLYKLPITVTLLQDTGIGRTVNGLCKADSNEVRIAAKSLVNKWKALVANESSAEESSSMNDNGHQSNESPKDKHHSHDHHKSKSLKKHRKEGDKIRREREYREHSSSNSNHHSKTSGNSNNQKDRAISSAASFKVDNGAENEGGESVRHSSSHRHASDHHRGDSGKGHGERKRMRDKHAAEESKGKGSSAASAPEKKQKRPKVEVDENDNDQMEIDCSAGTSFADALAMMDGPASTSVHNSMSSTSTKPQTKNPAKVRSESSSKAVAMSSSSSTSHADKSKSRDKDRDRIRKSSSAPGTSHGSGSSSSKSVASAKEKPLQLLAPTTKLPPLFDAEEMKKDILSAPVVISTSYTPTPLTAAYLNSAHISAAISKNKRPTTHGFGGPETNGIASSAAFEIPGHSRARTKVYSGNKSAQSVSTLHEMCIRVLQKNIDALEYTGGVPYDILKPILEKCTAVQLNTFEYYNPYLLEDTDELWQQHCHRQYRSKKRQEMESWRDMYLRCQMEEEKRLSHLTESIKQSVATSLPVKQTKLTYIDSKVPRMGPRRGFRGGGGNSAQPSINQSLTNRTTVTGTRMGHLTAGREVTSRRAPLMQKTLQLMKKTIKR